MVVLTQLVFYGLPWLEWGQRQAVLFDLASRRFYIFGLVLYPQDFIYLTGLLVISALSLFLFTGGGRAAVVRLCLPADGVHRDLPVDRAQGGRRPLGPHAAGRRAVLAGESWSRNGPSISCGSAWRCGPALPSWATSRPSSELGMEFLQTRMSSWEVFWVFFYGFATYGNAGFMREQVCKYMCPYARFQSAMFDKDTLIVSYDEGAANRAGAFAQADYVAKGLGDLCGLHAVRAGLPHRHRHPQRPAVRMHRLRRLRRRVRHRDGQDGLPARAGALHHAERHGRGWTPAEILRHVLRPRVLLYTAILGAVCLAMLASLILRTPLKVDVVRDRAALSRIVDGGRLENVLPPAGHERHRGAAAVPHHGHWPGRPDRGQPRPSSRLAPRKSRWVPVRLQIAYGAAAPGSHPIRFNIDDTDGNAHVSEKSVFLVPR
jgi:polyferredoxin